MHISSPSLWSEERNTVSGKFESARDTKTGSERGPWGADVLGALFLERALVTRNEHGCSIARKTARTGNVITVGFFFSGSMAVAITASEVLVVVNEVGQLAAVVHCFTS